MMRKCHLQDKETNMCIPSMHRCTIPYRHTVQHFDCNGVLKHKLTTCVQMIRIFELNNEKISFFKISYTYTRVFLCIICTSNSMYSVSCSVLHCRLLFVAVHVFILDGPFDLGLRCTVLHCVALRVPILGRYFDDGISNNGDISGFHASHAHTPIFSQINPMLIQHFIHLLGIESRESKHANLIRNMLPRVQQLPFRH
mmetsp:Transcript_41335/g.60855  ORF Transcript_41335/g.60855 Transcript_41335/m.60855 type:complete len:198 (+) Transcript_41335:30-623(+)